jgi:spore germination protein KC
MKWLAKICLSVCFLLYLTGCWNKEELIEFSFVQAVAMDETDSGKVQLTTLFYKPGQATAMGKTGGKKSFLTIKTEGKTTFNAIRDITFHLGRKAKWDHMRVLLVNEKLLKNRNLADLLDFFLRDHEPRANVLILIAKESASKFLEIKPFIENTVAQQIRTLDETNAKSNSKTIVTSLLELNLQLKSKTGVATLPTIFLNPKNSKEILVAGIVFLKQGKIIEDLSPSDVPWLLMITNKYKKGVIEIPCAIKENNGDVIEVNTIKSKILIKPTQNSLTVNVSTKVKGSIGELHCTQIESLEDELSFIKKIEKEIEMKLRKVTEHMQNKNVDAYHIGDMMYQKHLSIWKNWEKNNREYFSKAHFNFDVQVTIINTGTLNGLPASTK